MNSAELIVVSHGFQTSYERGFCNGLAENQLQLTLISSDRTDYAGLHPRIRTVNLRGSQDEGRSGADKFLNLVLYHLRLIAFVLGKRNAVIHVIGLAHPPLWCGVVEGLWFRLCNRRYLLTVHNLLPHDRHGFWMRVWHRLIYRLPAVFVVHTQAMRDQLIGRHHMAKESVLVMEHGIEPHAAMPAAAPQTRTSGPLHLLFFGIVARYKGLDLLLDALMDFDIPYTLMIAGTSTDTATLRDIRRRIAEHPATDKILWRDEFIPEADIPGLFDSADALVLPYRHIDQSGVLFQALRFGVPVIATQVGAFPEYVTEEIGETCPAESASALAAALRRLHGRLGRISRRRIAEIGNRYLWPSTVRAIMPAYE